MQILLSDRAIESLRHAPPNVRRAFEKQLRFLASNLLHHSLCAKKYLESANLWQAMPPSFPRAHTAYSAFASMRFRH
jgi:mRNA-degrading endonuclease RelE of RelBE toxin-antitoxin system